MYQSHENTGVGEQEYQDDARRIWPFSADSPGKRLRLSIAAYARDLSDCIDSGHADDSFPWCFQHQKLRELSQDPKTA
jgi:hypothetical protein